MRASTFGTCALLAFSTLIGSAIASDPKATVGPSAEAGSLSAYAVVERVIESPRCQNCHTVTAFPRQGDDFHRHRLDVMRGADGHGAPGLHCATCHGVANNASSGVPGAPDWHLAPLSMGWEGRSPAQRCRELKDPARNGHRSGAGVIDHLGTGLVRWAWSPGTDSRGNQRATPPVGYAAFIAAAHTWVDTGMHCPADSNVSHVSER